MATNTIPFALLHQQICNMKSISIIICTRNNENTIEQCLRSVVEQKLAYRELIVVDNHSTDHTHEIAERFTSQVLTCGPERSAQRNFGAKKAIGDFLLFIDSDMTIDAGLLTELGTLIQTNSEPFCVCIPEKTAAKGFWGMCHKFERDFYMIGDPSVDAARCYPRKEFLDLGGFKEQISATEDWDLHDRFVAKYPSSLRTHTCITHHDGEITFIDQMRKKRYYAKTGSQKYVLAHTRLVRKLPYPFRVSVFKQPLRFVQHPIIGLGSIVLKFSELIVVLLK